MSTPHDVLSPDARAVLESVVRWLSKDAHLKGVRAGIDQHLAEVLAERDAPPPDPVALERVAREREESERHAAIAARWARAWAATYDQLRGEFYTPDFQRIATLSLHWEHMDDDAARVILLAPDAETEQLTRTHYARRLRDLLAYFSGGAVDVEVAALPGGNDRGGIDANPRVKTNTGRRPAALIKPIGAG